MDKINDGGPAFPFEWPAPQLGPKATYRAKGMSMRDWFAGMALQGDWANSADGAYAFACTDEDLLRRAEMFYRMADAMLKARE